MSEPDTPQPEPLRKLMKRREEPGGASFITFSCEHRLPILGTSESRDIFARSLREARERFNCELFAWVAMPEHVHLIVRPPRDTALAVILKSMKLSASQRLLQWLRATHDPLLEQITRADGAPRIWQKGGGFDRNVRDEAEFQREVRYIHRNPVERGLVATPTQWAWSSARWWTARLERRDQDPLEIPCDWPPGGPSVWADWRG